MPKLLSPVAAVLASLAAILPASLAGDRVQGDPPQTAAAAEIQALDGDTLVVNGVVVKLAGVDAPELGPWARCWAEAALAGHAKHYVESEIGSAEGRWRLADVRRGRGGSVSARLVRSDGQDLSQLLVVGGYAAVSEERWEWCGGSDLHDPGYDEPPPHGPNLWWPSGRVFDPRAGD